MDETDLQWSRINQKGTLSLSKMRVGLQMRVRGRGDIMGKERQGSKDGPKQQVKGMGFEMNSKCQEQT